MNDFKKFEAVGLEPQNGELTAEQISAVKALGCLKDKRYNDIFNIRVVTRNGRLTTEEHRAVAEAADRFGSGVVALTVRLSMEIQGVPYAAIPDLILFLREKGLETGGTGAKVRPVVSCKGTVCGYGLIDTFALSEKIHNLFYVGYHGVALPHKFKIAVGGCPNNCVKPELNDIGIVGRRIVTPDYEKCRGCKKCAVEAACPMKAAEVSGGKITRNADICNNCGRCYKKCPFGVFDNATTGYRIYIGGRWGKKTAVGKPLDKILLDEKEVLNAVENAICFYRDEGLKGERFADTVERLGFEYAQSKLIGG